VKIRSFAHKGLKKLYEEDDVRGINSATVDKVRKMLLFLDDMEDANEMRALPTWKAHTLTGNRRGTWSLSVTANLRMTFRVDSAKDEIFDLNLEDYH
jgi:proteic killer suppression protein